MAGPAPRTPPPPAPRALTLALVAVALDGAEWLGMLLARSPAAPSPFWPADGVALVAVLLVGPRVWPALVVGTLGMGAMLAPTQLPFASALAALATLQALLTAWLMRRILAEPLELRLERDVLVFLFLVVPVSSLLDAAGGLLVARAFGAVAPGAGADYAFTWWAGDVIGLAAFTPMALALATRSSDRWRGRRLAVGLPLLVASLAVVLLARERRNAELDAARVAFDRAVADLGQRTTHRLEAHLDALVSLAAVKQELAGLSRLEFSAFARRSMANQPGWRGIDWVTRVPGAERAGFEAVASREGRDTFRIRELFSAGGLAPAPARPLHYPVLYSEPAERSWRMRGRDYAGDSARATLLRRAAELRHPVAGRAGAEALAPELPVVLVAQAVPGARPGDPPEGFVVGVLDPAALMAGLLPGSLEREIQVELRDSAAAGAAPLFARGPMPTAPAFVSTLALPLPGGAWVLRMAVGPEFLAAHQGGATRMVLVVGILLVTILAGLLLVISGRPAVLARMMADLTHRQLEVERELRARQEAEAALAKLEQRWAFALEATGTGVWEHDVPGGAFYQSPAWNAILGFGPDELEASYAGWADRLHPEDRAGVEAAYGALLRGESQGFERTYRLRARDDGWRWVLARGRGIEFGEDGRPLRVTGTLTDLTARLEAEEALAQSEQRFRLLVESIREVFWMTTEAGDRYTYLSPAFDDVWGFSREAALAEPERWRRSVHPDDLPGLLADTSFRDGRRREVEYRIRRPDGEERWIHERIFVVRDEQGRGVAVGGVSTDVTSRKQVEAELRTSEERFRRLVEDAPDGIFLHREGRIEYANVALERMVGAAAGQLAGRQVTDLLLPEHHDEFRERTRRLGAGETVPTTGLVWRRLDGTVFDAEVSSTAVPFAGGRAIQVIVRDVSQQRLQQALLRESERKYRALVETTGTGYVIFDRAGRVLDANREYLRLTGRPDLSQVIGHPVTAWTRPADRPRTEEALRRALGEGSIRHLETDYLGPGGQGLPVELNATVLVGSAGLQVIGLCRDISERRRAEEALAESARFVEQVLDTFPGPIAVRDAAGNLRLVNRVLADELGHPKAALLGAPPARAHVFTSGSGTLDAEVLAGRVTRASDEPFAGNGDGTHWYHVIRTPLERDGEVLLLQMGLDITARREAEEAFRQLNAELEDRVRERTAELERLNGMLREAEAALSQENHYLGALNELALALLAREDPELVLQALLRSACGLAGVGGGILRVADPDRARLASRLAWGAVPPGWLAATERGSGVSGRVLETGAPVLVADYARWPHRHPGKAADGIVGVAAVPLRSGEDVVGVLMVVQRPGEAAVGEDTLRILERFSRLAALVLDHATLQAALQAELDERRRAEERQRRLAADLLEAQRVGRLGSWVWEVGTDEVQLSAELLRLVGLPETRDRATLAEWTRVSHPHDQAEVQARLRALLEAPATGPEADRAEWDSRILRPDGEVRVLHVFAELQRDGSGRVTRLVGTSQDITERLAMEQALRESEERYRLAIRSTVDGVWDWPDVTQEEVFWSPRCFQLLGYAPGEFAVTASFYREALVHPEDLAAAEAGFQRHLALGEPLESEVRLRHKDGGWRWFRIQGEAQREPGRPIRLAGSMQDIDQVKLAALELERGRAMFAVFVEQSPTVCYLKDDAGRLQYVNQAFIDAMWEGTPPDWQGRSDFELWPRAQAEEYRRNEVRVLETGQAAVVEESFEREGGRESWLNFKFPVTLGTGERYLAGMAVNLTPQKRAEAEVRRLNAELEERVRRRTADLELANHELESFSYSVSHDLRTPLRAIDGFCQALLEDYALRLDETGRGYLTRVRSASQRMGLLIDDLLQLSRLTRGEIHLSSVDLSALAAEVVAELRAGDPARQVAVTLEPGLRAEGDPVLLRTVLANLLGNAWKFTSRSSGAAIRLGRVTTASGPAFVVEDNGVGFDPRYAGKLFGPFQRLHHRSEFEGSGIGLATVQRIIRRHGGRIWAEAAPGAGAAFFFTLGTEESS